MTCRSSRAITFSIGCRIRSAPQFNPALEIAIDEANRLRLPVLVGFGLTEDYPEANARHYAFMLEGLAETQQALQARGLGFVDTPRQSC